MRGHETEPHSLYCTEPSWLNIIKNTSWTDSQCVFLVDNTSEKALTRWSNSKMSHVGFLVWCTTCYCVSLWAQQSVYLKSRVQVKAIFPRTWVAIDNCTCEALQRSPYPLERSGASYKEKSHNARIYGYEKGVVDTEIALRKSSVKRVNLSHTRMMPAFTYFLLCF